MQKIIKSATASKKLKKEGLIMRNPNGYGSIKKLSGKRKRPFAVYITTEFKMSAVVPEISFLEDILTPDLYQQVSEQYEVYKEAQPQRARQVQKCIGYYETRPDAMIALAEYNKNPFDIDRKNITFEQVYDLLYEKEIKDMSGAGKTVYTNSYKKCDSLKKMRIREIKLAHLQNVVDQHSDKSKSTQNNIIVLFHAIYTLCMENDLCEKDYSQFVKITSKAEKKEKTPYSKQEIQTIWENINWMQTTPRKNALTGMHMMDSIIVMLYTGVRIGELLEIKIEDVHINERWIDLRGTKTKAAKRIVPIHKKILPLLKKRLSESTGEYLFCGNDGKKLNYSRYKTMFFELFMKEFKIDHTPHECRHTFATVAAASNMNKILLKKIIGHASSDITENVYTHAYIDDLIAEIDKYNL